MKKKVRRYTDDFKLKVVQEYLNTDVSKQELLQKYEIRGSDSILYWMRKFGLESQSNFYPELRQTMKEQIQKTPNDLESENKKLKEALERERLRTLALNTMIDIAERDLKIQIRKKSGAKQ